VHGEGPRWHLIEFSDTEHRVTRDAELADLRSKITSLYPKGSFAVSGVKKWRGKTELEEAVRRFVVLNGEYRVDPFTFLRTDEREMTVDIRGVIGKFQITAHARIPALNGQFGIRALCDIRRHTCFGQYFGGEIVQSAFGKVFDGTSEEHDHNIYAFDQRIDAAELRRLRQKELRMQGASEAEVEQMTRAEDTSEEATKPKVFIIDPFIGDWTGDELLLRYVNDCRADINCEEPTAQDSKFYNVEFVGMSVNGWPQTYLIAKRDIRKGEELMTYYGTEFSNAIATKCEEENKRALRQQRIDRDIVKGLELDVEGLDY